jgi:hypothetical protein
LAAYPDPKTGHPLIGAGFSLDLPAREHPQSDPDNPHPFIEPSSAELWQAAGLDSARLQSILAHYDEQLATWSRKGFRKRINTLTAQITDEEATQLVRVSAIQAVYNAKGYCRNFDQLAASQQMALSQLVYQMGYNLQEFREFLDLINRSPTPSVLPMSHLPSKPDDSAYWTAVQQSLIHSQWARLYRVRAVAVIAMLDPTYADGPEGAENRVGTMLRPGVSHRHLGGPTISRHLSASRTPIRRRLGRASSRTKTGTHRRQTA